MVLTWHKTCSGYNRERKPLKAVSVESEPQQPLSGQNNGSDMSILDLSKATVICGLLAFVIYSFPVVGQVLIIGVLSVLWLAYARKTLARVLRR